MTSKKGNNFKFLSLNKKFFKRSLRDEKEFSGQRINGSAIWIKKEKGRFWTAILKGDFEVELKEMQWIYFSGQIQDN